MQGAPTQAQQIQVAGQQQTAIIGGIAQPQPGTVVVTMASVRFYCTLAFTADFCLVLKSSYISSRVKIIQICIESTFSRIKFNARLCILMFVVSL